jgi:hypothetical protein
MPLRGLNLQTNRLNTFCCNLILCAIYFDVSAPLLEHGHMMALNFQIKDCMTRYNGDTDQQRRKKFSFPARLLCTDCYEVNKREKNANWLPMTNFDGLRFLRMQNPLID